MTKAVLVTFLTLCCHARASVTAASTAPEATCTTENEDTVAKVTKPGASVAKVTKPGTLTVTCQQGYSLFPVSTTDVFKTVECALPAVGLQSLVPGATMDKAPAGGPGSGVPTGREDASQKYTFTVVQMPLAAVSVFYLCQQANSESGLGKQGNRDHGAAAGAKRCTIEIQIAAGDPLGPNTCAVEGGRINLDLQAVGETARFSCSEKGKLLPESATRAYDSTCSHEVDLPHGLARRQTGNGYDLELTKLPKRAQQLCYLCEIEKTKTTSQSKRCQVHVRSAGAQPGGAIGARARGTSALSLALLAATGLYTS